MDDGLISSVDLAIKSCKIFATSGQAVDFKNLIAEFSYFEDIFSFGISGHMLINDSMGYINIMQLHGEERLLLEFTKPGMDNPIQKVFRVFKVSHRTQTSLNNENYILHFCTEELLLNEQYKVTKTYNKALVSDIVKDILLNYLHTDEKNIKYIDKTIGLKDLTIPLFKPIQAINWLATLALSGEKNSLGAPFLLYENKEGFYFKSILNLFKQDVYNTYYYEPKGIRNKSGAPDIGSDMLNAIKYEVIQAFDSASAIRSGMYSNKLITFDPVRLKFGETTFDYEQYKKNSESLDADGLPITNPNRNNDNVNKTPGVVKFSITSTGQSQNEYFKGKQQTIQENLIEQTVPYRTAQLVMFCNNRIKLQLPGDPDLTVGKIVKFNMPTVTYSNPNSRQKNPDEFYSGKYLVTAVRHYFNQENKFFTVIEICKDSFSTNYGKGNPSDSAWKS